ncbi:hypothetical protein V8E52_010206 [Russula decolorans]|jgi:hypothetical protein
MSFWDVSFTSSSSGTSTPQPQVAAEPSPSLNEEVTEVIGQLGRFWGGFRKQGQSAIQSARKDLGDYVSQAQRGLNNQISTTLPAASPAPASDTDTQSSTASSSRDLIDISTADGEGSASSSSSASTATLPGPQQQQLQRPDEAQSSLNAQTLFTRLQSSLPPDLLTGLRDTIPDSVRDAQARKELAQVAQARVQGAAARGEELLRGASVFLRDAVRVVPPEEADSFPSASTTPSAHEDTISRGKAVPTPIVVSSTPATRRGALLCALRENPAILRVDPAGEERSAALFVSWVERVGAEASRDESRRESELGADDEALRSTRSALVPGELTEDEFWTRYFFRVHQIDQEEERRKAVLAAGPTDQDDDFSWEDDDEDAALKAEASPTPTAPVLNRDKLLSVIDAPGTMSPQRSDDSYDIVSSGHASTAGDANVAHVSEDGTSDGDDDDDEDEDDDEEESDWE